MGVRRVRQTVNAMGVLVVLGFLHCAWGETDTTASEGSNDLQWAVAGEKLNYRLRWGFIEVGTATMEVQGPIEFHGQEAFQIKYAITTNLWADAFYRIRNDLRAYVDPGLNRTLGFTQKKAEGDYQSDVKVVVNWAEKKATRTNFGQPDGTQILMRDTFDPMSLIYAIRHVPLQPETLFYLPTTNGKRLVDTEVVVAEKDIIQVPAGRFKSILLQPDTQEMQGIFRKSKGAGIDLWVSDDYRKIPLKMKSKVVVGSFSVELVSVEGPNQDVPARLEEQTQAPREPRGRRYR